MTDLDDARRTRLYPDPDPRRSGRIGYLCQTCGAEQICPRWGLPLRGYHLSALTPGSQPRTVWVCSWSCLLAHVTTL